MNHHQEIKQIAATEVVQFEFVGVDDFTGLSYAFDLRDVELEEIENTPAIRATIVTAHGELEVVEWLDDDGDVERTDSNIKINLFSDLAKLFPYDRDSVYLPDDYAPIKYIFDALDGKIRK